jgi:serine/threonine-protein phosphatase Stp1
MWHSSSYTATGHVRSNNEDSILDLNQQRLWLVADGMGGHSSGEYASQLVTRTLLNFVVSPLAGISKERVVEALDDCNAQLVEKADREQAGVIGCTVALLQARQTSVICSWSGDSRIYRLRDNELKQLTRDHSLQSAVEDRDYLLPPATLAEPSQILTSAIGGEPQLALEHCWYQLQAGDSFLLCTDGLNKEVSDEEIRCAMFDSASGDKVLATLAQLYEERGARDNVGMVWVRNGVS